MLSAEHQLVALLVFCCRNMINYVSTEYGGTALHVAVRSQKAELVEALVDQGAGEYEINTLMV